MAENKNLTLWTNLKTVDRAFTKPITGKSYKGDSPNPTYVIQKITEQLGPIGSKWGFNVKFDRVRKGTPHQIIVKQHQEFGPASEDGTQSVLTKTAEYEIIREEYHEVCITFWLVDKEGQVHSFDAYGGTPMLYKSKRGLWIHDEDAAKKSLTDAYTKAASWLGTCADIFLGLFDSKYSGEAPEKDAQTPENSAQTGADPSPGMNGAKTPEGQRTTSSDEGW